jgi:hypothetical protein
MKRRALLALSVLALWPLAGRAEHADIDLRVTAVDRAGQADGDAHASADQEPPPGGVNARPLFKARAGEPLVLQFFLTNTYPHGELKNVTVRYFVVREAKARQKTVPDLRAGTVTQGSFVCNLKPKARVGARVRFTLREPGVYLLRVETANTQSDHEHFSAIDVKAE